MIFVRSLLHHAETCAASENSATRFVSLRSDGIAMIGVESAALVTNVARAFIELFAKEFTAVGGRYSEKIKKWDNAIRPWETMQTVGNLVVGLMASATFGWLLPDISLSIHRSLPSFPLKTLNLESKETALLPKSYVQEIKFMYELEVLDLTKRHFDHEGFNTFVQVIQEHPAIKEIHLSKSLCSDWQIFDLQKLAGSKKGLKIVDSDGGKFGSVYMDWHEYNIQKNQAYLKGMRETTIQALSNYFRDNDILPQTILDFGAGTGQDTIPLLNLMHLLKIDSHILAVDGDKEAIEILKSNLTPELNSHITCVTSSFKKFTITHPIDLLISSYTWPYRPPSDFPECWEKCVRNVKINGYIAGHFFGPITGEKPNPGMTYHTELEIKKLLKESGFEIKWFKKDPEGSEFEVVGGTGKPAWGDLYHLVAKKIQP